MKVEYTVDKKQVDFNDVEPGAFISCFDGSGLYLVVDNQEHAFCLDEEEFVKFSMDEKVIVRAGKVVVED
jgi:hypothetical protein